MEYITLIIVFIMACISLFSYLKVSRSKLNKKQWFHLSVIWAVVFGLFAIFSAIFLLVALFSIITGEWDTQFLFSKFPVFVTTLICYRAFSYFKSNFKNAAN
ncbi:MAG: hypothetical protein ABNH21_11325 [Glaciecola sp.]|jgi:hypothetical protein